MTKNMTAALVAAAVLALPLTGRAGDNKPPKGPGCGGVTGSISAEAAKQAVAGASARAAEALKTLSTVPVEFAGVLTAMPYGSEPVKEVKTMPELSAALDAKAAYWKAVTGALKAEQGRLSDEIDEMSRNGGDGVDQAVVRSAGLMRLSILSEAIEGDVAADKAFIGSGLKSESGQKVIERKTALAKRLADAKR
jgi:hypothetical protein